MLDVFRYKKCYFKWHCKITYARMLHENLYVLFYITDFIATWKLLKIICCDLFWVNFVMHTLYNYLNLNNVNLY